MKRFVILAVLLLLCTTCPTSMEAAAKKPTVDMSNVKTIFVGWVAFDPEEYSQLEYSSKEDWLKDIDRANAYFQSDLKSKYLAGKTLTIAKNRDDVNAAGNDLYIKFTDVTEDKGYRLHMTIHFIDPKTNAEIAVFPSDTYKASGHFCVLEGCMEIELNKVGELLNKQAGPNK